MARNSRAIPRHKQRKGLMSCTCYSSGADKECAAHGFVNTNELAATLGIGREAARLLMKKTRGAVTLPALNGTGKRETRRMPRKVLGALIVARAKNSVSGAK